MEYFASQKQEKVLFSQEQMWVFTMQRGWSHASAAVVMPVDSVSVIVEKHSLSPDVREESGTDDRRVIHSPPTAKFCEGHVSRLSGFCPFEPPANSITFIFPSYSGI